VLGAVGLQMMARFATGVDFHHVMMARIVQASGIAFLFIPISTLSYSHLKKEDNTAASGLINLARNIGGSIGISLAETFVSRYSQTHQTYLAAHVTSGSPAYRAATGGIVQTLVHQGVAAADALHRAQAIVYQMVQKQATMLAYVDVFRMMSYAFLLGLPLLFLLQKPKAGAVAMH
jgi:DHA2 family multidrug resistance protein